MRGVQASLGEADARSRPEPLAGAVLVRCLSQSLGWSLVTTTYSLTSCPVVWAMKSAGFVPSEGNPVSYRGVSWSSGTTTCLACLHSDLFVCIAVRLRPSCLRTRGVGQKNPLLATSSNALIRWLRKIQPPFAAVYILRLFSFCNAPKVARDSGKSPPFVSSLELPFAYFNFHRNFVAVHNPLPPKNARALRS